MSVYHCLWGDIKKNESRGSEVFNICFWFSMFIGWVDEADILSLYFEVENLNIKSMKFTFCFY